MNHNKSISMNMSNYRILYNEENVVNKLTEQIISWFPRMPREYVVVCIGTDRSTGDSLGPLTGSLFSAKKPKHMKLYGTLHQPVHATNLTDYMKEIAHNHKNPFIIAIDACLGKNSSVGNLITGVGPVLPGAALKKSLPEIGDVHITGVVNMSGFMEHSILQNTRLSVVMDMAEIISAVLDSIDQRLSTSINYPAVLRRPYKQMG
ncbi:spore protease YyaC [Oceanobacillus sp. FSL H7-0719]|uniref:spore protease YyaC n=1 Tax=Oceanobacillus sp. FSL H7-0719 TaxID=2954507 RepID=UPI003251B57D